MASSRLSLAGRWGVALALTWGLYFLVLFSRMLWLDPDGSIVAGHANVWSDWSLHIGFATIFAKKSPADWFAYHPMYADGKLTYPFLTNFISGMMMRAGFSLPSAFILPSIAFAWIMLAGMHRLFTRLLGSPAKSFLAITLFFTCGGMGFVQYARDLWNHFDWDMLIYPPNEYGRVDSLGWYSSNWLTGILIPQRASLMGVAMALWSMNWLFEVIENGIENTTENTSDASPRAVSADRNKLISAGVLAGFLPIAHMHSFIFVVEAAGLACLIQWRRWRELLAFVIPAALLSVALYETFVAGGIETHRFMSIQIGYTAQNWFGWIGFWGYIWGATFPASIFGAYLGWREFSLTSRCFLIAAAVMFVLANIVQFQPVQWDNSKLFMWSYLGVAAGATACVSKLWSAFPGKAGRILTVGLVGLMSLTGSLEILRLQQISRHSFTMMDGVDAELGDQVRENTGPRERFLTDMIHNHWVMMSAARPILMGYSAWVMNYGFNFMPTEADIREIYSGNDHALSLLAKHRIHYVVIGPSELRNQHANEIFFHDRFPIAFQNQLNRVYDVSSAGKTPQ